VADVNSYLIIAGEVSTPIVVSITLGTAIVCLVVGFLIAQMVAGNSLKRANEERGRMLEAARQEASTLKKEAELEGEKSLLKRRQDLEDEFHKAQEEVKDHERRVAKREDNLDRKMEALESKERFLEVRSKEVDQLEKGNQAKAAELGASLEKQKEELLRIAGLSEDEARERVMKQVEEDLQHEINQVVQKKFEEAEQEVKTQSREIVLSAIQRYAGEYVSESTVRAVPIPSDDMKGRIIGREGRNIRAIERATGVDVMVDDTPGVISVSCFDKVRQAVAVEALGRLIADGRVHPTRIEEVVEKVQEEISEKIVQYGKAAANEVKIGGLHPKINEAMGRMHYRTSFGQNVLQHSIEVAYLSQIIADQLGLDGTIARRCGYLHDIGKAMDHEVEGGHPKIGMDFLRKFGEGEEVCNAAGGHHGDIPATTPYTPIVMAADAISGARPGARRESMEHYIQRLEQLEGIARENQGVEEAYAIQAGREVRVIVDCDKVSDSDAFGIAKKIAERVSEEMTFPGEIKVTVLRETRAVEIAR